MLRAPAAWLLAAWLAWPAAGISAQTDGLSGETTVLSAPAATPVPAPRIPAEQKAESSGPTPSASVPVPPQASGEQRRKAEGFYLKGLRAVYNGDAIAAEHNFSRAAAADPANPEYAIDSQLARSQAAMALIRRADKARIQGNQASAEAQLRQALAIDPGDPEVSQHTSGLSSSPQSPLLENATVTLAPEIVLAPTSGEQNFHLRDSEQEVLRRVLTAYGLSPTFDSSVGTKRIPFDTGNVTFAQAAKMAQLATGCFFVPLDPKRVLVAKDNRENRTRYERESVETLTLPSLPPAEMTDVGNVVRNIFAVQRSSVQQNGGTITVRAPQGVLTALNRTLANLLQGNGEVLLEVKLFEVAKTRTRNLGIQPPQSITLFNVPSELNNIIQQNPDLVQQIISSGLANAGDYAAIAAILIASGQVSSSILGQPSALFGGGLTESGIAVPGVTANLALNSSDTRVLDQIQLRLSDNQEGTIRSGSRYPIETSNYSSLAGSAPNIPGLTSAGLSSTLAGLGVNLSSLTSAETIPQVQYQDLGMTLTVTPKIERDSHIALNLALKLTALQGTNLNGLPVLTNQSYTANVTDALGASTLLVSDMTRQESKAVSGIPGLSDLPGFQSTTNDQSELDTSKLVILITPHLLLRGHGETTGPYVPLPLGSGRAN